MFLSLALISHERSLKRTYFLLLNTWLLCVQRAVCKSTRSVSLYCSATAQSQFSQSQRGYLHFSGFKWKGNKVNFAI